MAAPGLLKDKHRPAPACRHAPPQVSAASTSKVGSSTAPARAPLQATKRGAAPQVIVQEDNFNFSALGSEVLYPLFCQVRREVVERRFSGKEQFQFRLTDPTSVLGMNHFLAHPARPGGSEHGGREHQVCQVLPQRDGPGAGKRRRLGAAQGLGEVRQSELVNCICPGYLFDLLNASTEFVSQGLLEE